MFYVICTTTWISGVHLNDKQFYQRQQFFSRWTLSFFTYEFFNKLRTLVYSSFLVRSDFKFILNYVHSRFTLVFWLWLNGLSYCTFLWNFPGTQQPMLNVQIQERRHASRILALTVFLFLSKSPTLFSSYSNLIQMNIKVSLRGRGKMGDAK